VLAAKGIDLEPKASKDGRGREATYRALVHKNGSIVIGETEILHLATKLHQHSRIPLKLRYQ
jgi:hypothetical protein